MLVEVNKVMHKFGYDAAKFSFPNFKMYIFDEQVRQEHMYRELKTCICIATSDRFDSELFTYANPVTLHNLQRLNSIRMLRKGAQFPDGSFA